MGSDRFTRFTCDLAKRIDKDEEVQASMVEQLFHLQQKALEKKVREKKRQLKAMEAEKSPRWVEKRMRKVLMQAEAEHAEIERQLAESKALHTRRKLHLSEMEHQVYSWRSSTLRLKKRSQSSDAEKRVPTVDDATTDKAAEGITTTTRAKGDASPFSSGYSTPSSGSSMKFLPTLVPPMLGRGHAPFHSHPMDAFVSERGSATPPSRDGSDIGRSSAKTLSSSATEIGRGMVDHGPAADRGSSHEQGRPAERASADGHAATAEPRGQREAEVRRDAPVLARAGEGSQPAEAAGVQACGARKAERSGAERGGCRGADKEEAAKGAGTSCRGPERIGVGEGSSPEEQCNARDGTRSAQREATAARVRESQTRDPGEKISGSSRDVCERQLPQSQSAPQPQKQRPKGRDEKEDTPAAQGTGSTGGAVGAGAAGAGSGAGKGGRGKQEESPMKPTLCPPGSSPLDPEGVATATAASLEQGEDSINLQLHALRQEMTTTRLEIQASQNLQENDAKMALFQRQKEAARQLYEQKQNLINERVRLIKLKQEMQLEQDQRDVDELLDKALRLNVNEEVQRQIKPSSGAAGEDVCSDAEGSPVGMPRKEWEAKEEHLAKLRAELAAKQQAVEQMRAEKQRQRQTREEQRLMRELQQVEEEAEKLRYPAESDDEGSGEPPQSTAAGQGRTPPAGQGFGAPGAGQAVPDAITEAELEVICRGAGRAAKAQAARQLEARVGQGQHEASAMSPAPVHKARDASAAMQVFSSTAAMQGLPARASDKVAEDASHARAAADPATYHDEAVCSGDESAPGSEVQQPVPAPAESIHYAGSCGASTNSSDEGFYADTVEVGVGGQGFHADEWECVQGGRGEGSGGAGRQEYLTGEKDVDRGEDQLPVSAGPRPDAEVDFSSPGGMWHPDDHGGLHEKAKPHAEAECSRAQGTGAETTRGLTAVDSAGKGHHPDPESRDPAHPHGAAPTPEAGLRHPTPIVPTSLISDMFIEDGASSVESEPTQAAPQHAEGERGEAQLMAALISEKARGARLAALPPASVQVDVPLKEVVHKGGLATHACEKIQAAVAHCRRMRPYGVEPEDVSVVGTRAGLRCDVRLRRGGSSVLAVVEALSATLRDQREARDFERALTAAGADESTTPQITPRWPLERLQVELELRFGYNLALSQLEELARTVAAAARAQGRAWDRLRSQASGDLEALVNRESMALFHDPRSSPSGDELLPLAEGARRRLPECVPRQGASRLGDLLADAAKAQRQLKRQLAPDTDWGQAKLSDTRKVPRGHQLRLWQAEANHPLPEGMHYDPGTDSRERVVEKALCQMVPADKEPPVEVVVDASQLSVIFDTVQCLRAGLDWCLAHLDVVWLENRFQSPGCRGYHEVSLGVRQQVPCSRRRAQERHEVPCSRCHVSELRLSLRELHEAKRAEEPRLRETLRSMLAASGVKEKDLEAVQRVLLRTLDCTDGQAARDALRDLRYTMEKVKRQGTPSTDGVLHVSKDLVKEAKKRARATGVSEELLRTVEDEVAEEAARRAGEEARRRTEEDLAANLISASSSESDDNAGLLGADGGSQISGSTALPADGDKGGLQFIPAKDVAPPRPPSPPPDVHVAQSLSAATAEALAPKRRRSSDQTVDHITGELMSMLLTEVSDEFAHQPELVKRSRAVAAAAKDRELRPAPEPAQPSSPAPGHHGIDTSESVVGPFLDAALPLLGASGEACTVVTPLDPVDTWLPNVLEVMWRREGVTSDEGPGGREHDVASFTRLLGDALVEIASEEAKAGPRMRGWRRPGFGEAPLARFQAKQAEEGQSAASQQTWDRVRTRLVESVKFGCRFESWDNEAFGHAGLGDVDCSPTTLANIDEGIDALLEEEICTDEASWLDISKDEHLVKNQVVQMIFADLIDEMVTEMREIWPT